MTTIIDKPDLIHLASMRALIGALKLEKLGLKRRCRPSALQIAKRNYPVTGRTREAVYTELCEHYEQECQRLGVSSTGNHRG